MTRQDREKLIEQYMGGYHAVANALQGFPDSGLTAHPIPGKWSAAEIVHHLADSETTSAQRLRKLLTEEHPVLTGYDQDLWATRLRYNERDTGPALIAFRAARETTGQLLATMTDADWTREGWHTESGRYSAETWLSIYAVHAHNHAEQLRRLRKALGA